MKAAFVVASAGLSFPLVAIAQTSLLDLKVSTDGVHWREHVDVGPGSQVAFGLFVSLQGAEALGLSGFNFQPTVSNWDTTGDSRDSVLPFASRGANFTTPPGGVTEQSGEFGRIFPWAGPNTNLFPLTGHVDGGNLLRIAQQQTTNRVGFGQGSNNVNGAGGVPLSQGGANQLPPYFHYGTQDLLVFRFGLQLSDDATFPGRTLAVDIPAGSLEQYPNGGVINWVTALDANGIPIRQATSAIIDPASISVGEFPRTQFLHHPSPGGAVLLGPAMLVVTRRRRR